MPQEGGYGKGPTEKFWRPYKIGSSKEKGYEVPAGAEQKKKWIKGAIKHPGALTRKAKAAGVSPMAYAQAHKGSPGRTGKQARLAITLSKLRKK